MRLTESQGATQSLIKVCYGSSYWQDLNPIPKPSFDGEREMSFPSSQLCTVGGERYLQAPGAPEHVHATSKDKFENQILNVNVS